jgi:hypothetical protein
MFKCVFLYRSFREELRGIPRANNAKDVDWSKVANSVSIEVTTKPVPIKISVSEVLKRVRPQKQNTDATALQNVVDSNGKQHRYASYVEDRPLQGYCGLVDIRYPQRLNLLTMKTMSQSSSSVHKVRPINDLFRYHDCIYLAVS